VLAVVPQRYHSMEQEPNQDCLDGDLMQAVGRPAAADCLQAADLIHWI
jgi:hypothetical protein